MPLLPGEPQGEARLYGAWMATSQYAENEIEQKLITNPLADPPR